MAKQVYFEADAMYAMQTSSLVSGFAKAGSIYEFTMKDRAPPSYSPLSLALPLSKRILRGPGLGVCGSSGEM